MLEVTKGAVHADSDARYRAAVNPEPFLLRNAKQSLPSTCSIDMKKLIGDQDHMAKENGGSVSLWRLQDDLIIDGILKALFVAKVNCRVKRKGLCYPHRAVRLPSFSRKQERLQGNHRTES
ncbi:MAG: hypothetical protein ACLPH3_03145 [Terracidiphilus sp.]